MFTTIKFYVHNVPRRTRNVSSMVSQVINGDSCRPETFLELGLESNRADILITDPPYCLLNRRRKSGELRDPKKVVKKIDNQPTVPKYDNIAEYRAFTRQWLRTCVENGLKPSAPLIIWTNALGKATIVNSCKELSYNLRGEYLWAKRTDTKGLSENSTKNEVMLRVYETALVFQHSSESPSTEEEVRVQRIRDASLPWSVVTGYHDSKESSDSDTTANTDDDAVSGASDSDSGGDAPSSKTSPRRPSPHRYFTPSDHPCHKPLAALFPLVSTWSKPGNLVLDPFSGSGAIALCVLRAGEDRSVRGVEIVEQWAHFAQGEIEGEAERRREKEKKGVSEEGGRE